MIELHELKADSPLAQEMYDIKLGTVVSMVSAMVGAGIEFGLISEERALELETECDPIANDVIEGVDKITDDGLEYILALGQVVTNLFVSFMIWSRKTMDIAMLRSMLDSGDLG